MARNLSGERKGESLCVYITSITFTMQSLCRLTPGLFDTCRSLVAKKILAADYNFDADVWHDRSQEGKDCVSLLLEIDPQKRLDAEEALKHPWFSSEANMSNQEPDLQTMIDTQNRLLQYAESGEFRKIVMNVIAKRATTDDILELREIFNEYDSDKDGTISLEDWKKALAKSNVSDEVIQSIFHKLVSRFSVYLS